MNWAALFFSRNGTVKPGPFGLAIAAVYVLSFVSFALPTTSRPAILALLLFQLLMTWCWYVLHAKRLADAGRGMTVALILAVLYVFFASAALYIAYEAIPQMPAQQTTPGATPVDTPPPNSIAAIIVILLFAYMFNTGNFGIVIWLLALLLLVPLVIGVLIIIYSIVVGVRPSITPDRAAPEFPAQ